MNVSGFAVVGRRAALAAVVCVSQVAFAQAPSPVIYPAKGQDAKQQEMDKYECYSWAKGQSGFDPAQPAQTTVSTSAPAASGAKAGAMVAGAAGGAAVAELTHHDAGRGAAVGAVGGGLKARAR